MKTTKMSKVLVVMLVILSGFLVYVFAMNSRQQKFVTNELTAYKDSNEEFIKRFMGLSNAFYTIDPIANYKNESIDLGNDNTAAVDLTIYGVADTKTNENFRTSYAIMFNKLTISSVDFALVEIDYLYGDNDLNEMTSSKSAESFKLSENIPIVIISDTFVEEKGADKFFYFSQLLFSATVSDKLAPTKIFSLSLFKDKTPSTGYPLELNLPGIITSDTPTYNHKNFVNSIETIIDKNDKKELIIPDDEKVENLNQLNIGFYNKLPKLSKYNASTFGLYIGIYIPVALVLLYFVFFHATVMQKIRLRKTKGTDLEVTEKE